MRQLITATFTGRYIILRTCFVRPGDLSPTISHGKGFKDASQVWWPIHDSLRMLQLHKYPENTRIYLFTEYAYLWELWTLLRVKCCIYTPLYNYKHVGKLHLSEKLLPNANYGSAIYRMKEVQWIRSLERSWRHKQVVPWYIFIWLTLGRQ